MGDLRYGDYVPNNIKPIDLSREFLITVRIGYIYLIKFFSTIAYSIHKSKIVRRIRECCKRTIFTKEFYKMEFIWNEDYRRRIQ